MANIVSPSVKSKGGGGGCSVVVESRGCSVVVESRECSVV